MAPRFRFRLLPDGTYGWMLLGGNNRLIGVAAAGAPTPARAVTNAERAREIAAAAHISFMVADDRLWYWRIQDSGVPLAVSASGFARRLDAARAARRFVPYRHAVSTRSFLVHRAARRWPSGTGFLCRTAENRAGRPT